MKRLSSPLAGALPMLALALVIEMTTADQAAAVSHSPCSTEADFEAARNAFRMGKELFNRQRWLAAEIHFLRALDCSGKIKEVRSYGRWREAFDPETYLGLTMHRIGCCLAPGGRRCPLASDWHDNWEDFLKLALATNADLRDDWELAKVDFPGQQRCGTKVHLVTINGVPRQSEDVCGMPGCLLVRGSRVVYCPVIDWWSKLVAGSVAPKTVVSTRCKDTATLAEKLWTALRLGGDPADGTNPHICEAMVRELARVDESCGGY